MHNVKWNYFFKILDFNIEIHSDSIFIIHIKKFWRLSAKVFWEILQSVKKV